MPAILSRIAAMNKLLDKVQVLSRTGAGFTQYRDDPVGYARDVLKVTLTPDQVKVVGLLLREPRKLLVSAGHSVGKSMLAAVLVCWFFDTRDPGLCITTAPKFEQVKSIIWAEVRSLRHAAGLPDLFAGPKAPHLETGPKHLAYGLTAADSNKFQGKHNPGGLLIIFDEAEGIDAEFYRALKTMIDCNSYFLGIYNPTGGSGTATHEAERQADEDGLYNRITLSCLNHPNVQAQLKGEPLVIPGAIDLDQLRSMLKEDSVSLGPTDERQPGDVELTPGEWYRPGPIASARCLGRRPLLSRAGVWSEELWQRMTRVRHEVRPEWGVQIGCDVARYGDCMTTIFVRKGYCMLHAEAYGKQGTDYTARRLREVAHRFADDANPERRIPIKIDEGQASGVIDYADGYLFLPINSARVASKPERYVNVRAELWFAGREPALNDCMDVSRLPGAILTRLRQELLSTEYELVESNGKIRVEEKAESAEKLKRSPDLADGWNLAAYLPGVKARAA